MVWNCTNCCCDNFTNCWFIHRGCRQSSHDYCIFWVTMEYHRAFLWPAEVKVEFGVRTSILTIAAKKKCEMVGQLTNDSGQTTSSSSKVNVRWTWQPSAIAWLYLRGLASELVPQDPNDQGLYGCSNTLCVTNFRTHMVGNDLWYVPISWTNSYREIMFTTP